MVDLLWLACLHLRFPDRDRLGRKIGKLLDSRAGWQVSRHMSCVFCGVQLVADSAVGDGVSTAGQKSHKTSPAAGVYLSLLDALHLHLDSVGISSLPRHSTSSQRNMHILQSCGPIGDSLFHAPARHTLSAFGWPRSVVPVTSTASCSCRRGLLCTLLR